MKMSFAVMKPLRWLGLLPLCGVLLLASAATHEEMPPSVDVPYVPTPMEVVHKMLEVADVGPSDIVYDLGCGDGRIVITAASERGARGVGIDLNPLRIREAKAKAKEAGVEDRARFHVGDLFDANISRATVVTLYLLPQVNYKLRPQLWEQLKVGTRVVSHDFDMGADWPPDRVESVGGKMIYYWTIRTEHKNKGTRKA